MNHCTLALAVLVLASAPAMSAEVYRWVDDDGVVHYSQWAPESRQEELATIDMPTSTPEDYDPDEDPYSVLNQAARIHETLTALVAAGPDIPTSSGEPSRSTDEDNEERRYRTDLIAYAPAPRRPARRDPLRVQRRQLEVVDELERRDTERAYSINSSVHRARVAASAEAVETVLRRPGKPRQH